MSLAKLQAALASATNEVTIAAANINFDFALVKMEAPKEYQLLGGLLSRRRKDDAESGSSHVTARRLGALFEGICSHTPNLMEAYGKRVSQIAEVATNDSKEYSDSVFAAFSGVDATSIWAAATSSRTSIHVHLLACMLAHVFEAPEAISIWVELVQEQRLKIAARLEKGESLPFSLAAAAGQQDISRSQLAEWDSSARAWLRTANKVKHRQQTQLRLVLENIHLPVNAETVVFSSVINAWRSALVTMENLASGMPQAISGGAAVLGLSAWHLYPDMNVFGTMTADISMKDDLIPVGGVLSLGLTSPERDSHHGVYWSLSLAHMRYYGPPVNAQTQLTADVKRLTFSQLQQAVLGTLLGLWKTPATDTSLYIRFVHTLCSKIENYGFKSQSGWAQFLAKAASTYLRATGEDAEISIKLINLGRRRARDFIPQNLTTHQDLPFFNLNNPNILFGLLNGHEERIQLLRRLASKMAPLYKVDNIIRYSVPNSKDAVARDHKIKVNIPQVNKREPSDPENDDMELDGPEVDDMESGTSNTECHDDMGLVDPLDDEIDDQMSGSESTTTTSEKRFKNLRKASCYATVFPQFPIFLHGSNAADRVSQESIHHRWGLKGELQLKTLEPDLLQEIHHPVDGILRSEGMNIIAKNLATESETTFAFLFGDSETAAIYTRITGVSYITDEHVPKIECEDLLWCLDSGYVAEESLAALLTNLSSSVFQTFYALSVAAMIYESLSDATVDVRTLELPFMHSPFAKCVLDRSSGPPAALWTLPHEISLRLALSLVAYFEGGSNVPLHAFDNSIALSAEDSIYVSKKVSSLSRRIRKVLTFPSSSATLGTLLRLTNYDAY